MTYRLMTPDEITISDIQKVLNMESLVYDEEEQQTLERCIQFFSIDKSIYLFFKDAGTDEIIGNINCMPVNLDCYRMIRSGNFTEKDISPEMILPRSGMAYFSGITIREDYRNTALLRYMIREFLSSTVGMMHMIADAVTNEGARLCRLFGMSEICRSGHGSVIYEKASMHKG